MSRSPWNFSGGPWLILSRGDEQFLVIASGELPLDSEGELGEIAVADHLAELPFGFEHPGCGPAQAHVAGLPALDVAGGAADGLDHGFARVGRLQRLLEQPAYAEPRHCQRLLQPFAQ